MTEIEVAQLLEDVLTLFTVSEKHSYSEAGVLWNELTYILPIWVEIQRIDHTLSGFLRAANETEETEQQGNVHPVKMLTQRLNLELYILYSVSTRLVNKCLTSFW